MPLIQALAEGKTIQYFQAGIWFDEANLEFSRDYDKYRIKSAEPKLRVWKFNNVPVGALLKNSNDLAAQLILGCNSIGVKTCWGFNCDHVGGLTRYETLLDKDYKYSIDGGKNWLPCGILE